MNAESFSSRNAFVTMKQERITTTTKNFQKIFDVRYKICYLLLTLVDNFYRISGIFEWISVKLPDKLRLRN